MDNPQFRHAKKQVPTPMGCSLEGTQKIVVNTFVAIEIVLGSGL